MIMSHDAATSYYSPWTCTLVRLKANLLMTQTPGTLTSQLNCGARALDLRPYSVGSKLISHHGPAKIYVNYIDMLKEVIQWASRNPNELVVVYGSHCAGAKCSKMFRDAVSSAEIPLIKCQDIANLTLGSAHKRGRLPIGGSILAVWGCTVENFDPKITCYPELWENTTLADGINDNHTVKDPRFLSSCYGANAQKAFDPLWAYMSSVCDGHGKQQGLFWMAQAHWQQDVSSMAQSELHLSCALKDDALSHLHEKLVQKISQGLFSHINFLEVDNVCGGHGPSLFRALRARFTYDIDVQTEEAIVI